MLQPRARAIFVAMSVCLFSTIGIAYDAKGQTENQVSGQPADQSQSSPWGQDSLKTPVDQQAQDLTQASTQNSSQGAAQPAVQDSTQTSAQTSVQGTDSDTPPSQGQAQSQAPPTKPPQYDNWYPKDNSAPPGVSYSTKVAPLPLDLAGIPDVDKPFINHVFSEILKALQAKTVMLAALNKSSGYAAAYATYAAATADARAKIAAEKTPPGMGDFRQDVLMALDAQVKFFAKAQALRQKGKMIEEAMEQPEGRAASDALQKAWAEMARRYQQWTGQVKTSVYHHISALDLY